MLKRLFDIFFSLIALAMLSPLFVVVSLLISLSSKGPVFYRQVRVGLNDHDFHILKFRTMHTGADKGSLLTVGGRDSRITAVGFYLRKYKIDELPQFINVLIGEMSIVGPRPEVRRYVSMYTAEQKKVLMVKPGITDYASIEFSNENELLGSAKDPEAEYVNYIMPAKLKLNLEYIRKRNFSEDVLIIFKTLARIVTSR